MSRRTNNKSKFLKIWGSLFSDHPEIPIGRHLEMAFADYKNPSEYSEKEIVYALEKYQKEVDLDILNIAPDDYVKKIQEDAEHLFDPLEEDEEI
ncbi:MAG TPA: hypothetical protein PLS56_01415 [Candidatus Dojkabacteria bacterium]|nr:hypothetical protein [Candidatus Dojkabacteria bacterium]